MGPMAKSVENRCYSVCEREIIMTIRFDRAVIMQLSTDWIMTSYHSASVGSPIKHQRCFRLYACFFLSLSLFLLLYVCLSLLL